MPGHPEGVEKHNESLHRDEMLARLPTVLETEEAV
jgi:hypothetical protein